jgi:hypothetical protein
MYLIARRLSPSLVIAIGALFVALAGTAAAAVIIDSPDQIKDGVVTGPKLANEAVTSAKIPDRSILQQDEAHPTLRARVAKNGKVSTGDNVEIKHVAGSNRYDLRFQAPKLGPLGMNVCAFVVTPQLHAVSPIEARPVRAYVNYALDKPTVQVFTYAQRADGREFATEAGFDLVLAC